MLYVYLFCSFTYSYIGKDVSLVTVCVCVCVCVCVQAESVGGFKIVHEVDGGNDLVFKFHQKSKLQGGASVTVSLDT